MDICTCNPRKHGTFFINGRLICIYCRQPIADDTKQTGETNMNKLEMEHLERVTNICANRGELITQQATRIIELVEARGSDEVKIENLEAQNILLTRTINEQAQVIREHEAADVIAVEAIRAQAAEIELLKEKVRYAYVQIAALEKEDDDDYGYAQQKNFY